MSGVFYLFCGSNEALEAACGERGEGIGMGRSGRRLRVGVKGEALVENEDTGGGCKHDKG